MHIVYKSADDKMVSIFPVPACGLSIEDIARKDVPAGQPYVIVDGPDSPIDMATPDGYGADYGTGSRNAVIAIEGDYIATLPTVIVNGQEVIDSTAQVSIFQGGQPVATVPQP